MLWSIVCRYQGVIRISKKKDWKYNSRKETEQTNDWAKRTPIKREKESTTHLQDIIDVLSETGTV